MIHKITHFTLYVRDQEASLDFFVNKLEFELHTDTMFGDMRWLTVCPVDQKYFEIALMLPTNDDEKSLVGRQAAKNPILALATDNCQKDYELFKERGVSFIEAPNDQPWGIQALFTDLDGNIYNLYEPK